MYRSHDFKASEVRNAYAELRETVVADYRAKTGSTKQVRIPTNLIFLVDADQGLTICQGLENGVYHAKGHAGFLRWEVRINL